MELFLKTAAGTLLTLVLILTVGKQEKDLALLLGVMACCMIAITALRCLRPVLDFLYRLEAIGDLGEQGFGILLKIVGIGFLGEIAGLVCQDAGNASLGRQLQILASAVILGLSLPFLESLVDILENLLGGL